MDWENRFKFSCEFSDHKLRLIYYNYSHLNLTDRKWISRDLIQEKSGWNLYSSVKNPMNFYIDSLGLGLGSIIETVIHQTEKNGKRSYSRNTKAYN